MGRFTGVDPIRSSGRVENPQTWGRYTYVLNNPLKFVDPSGAYEFSAALGGNDTDEDLQKRAKTDEEKAKVADIISQRGRIRGAIDALNKALADKNSKLTSKEKDALTRAVKAYGTFRDGNKVVVGLGTPTGGAQGRVNGHSDPNGYIQVNFDDRYYGSLFATFVAHEGSHVADWQEFNASDALSPNFGGSTRYETERKAFEVTSIALKAFNLGGVLSLGGNSLWEDSWSSLPPDDQAQVRSRNIDKVLESYTADNGRPLSRENPGLTFGERKTRLVPH
jgi:hypothetical protein